MNHRTLTADEVSFTVECLPEDLPLEGNIMASGDDVADQAAEEDIRRQFDAGNQWAWCVVKVSAIYTAPNGQVYLGLDYLGGCSYKSERDFKSDTYYFDLKERALEDLNQSIAKIAESIPT